MMKKRSLKKFVYLSIAASLLTIALKTSAYLYTGSMGLLSDALESVVNLLAAVIALILIQIAERPADEDHKFGHTKAEYFSSLIEGGLIMVAAFSIIWNATPRLLNPQPIDNIGIGVVISLIATAVNLAVGMILIHHGKMKNSLLLEADGRHLMADVFTSVGVIVAIILIRLTGWLIIDPIIAILVALHIISIGVKLMKRSADGLMDKAIPEEEMQQLTDYLDSLTGDKIDYHSLMTRQAGQRKFITFHLLVPGEWSVQQGHDFSDKIEETIEDLLPDLVTVTTHIEPIEDPASMRDIGIDRKRKRKSGNPSKNTSKS